MVLALKTRGYDWPPISSSGAKEILGKGSSTTKERHQKREIYIPCARGHMVAGGPCSLRSITYCECKHVRSFTTLCSFSLNLHKSISLHHFYVPIKRGSHESRLASVLPFLFRAPFSSRLYRAFKCICKCSNNVWPTPQVLTFCP